MDKLPFSELEKRLSDATEFISPGSRWLHYKGNEYIVIDAVIIEATNEVGLLYRPLKHPTVTFLRPLVVWQEVVEFEGKKMNRFRRLGD